MPLSLHERNPTLTARVDDAYERALLAQGELASGVGSVALDNLIDGDVAAAREQGNLVGGGLEAVSNPDTRATFGETLTQSEQLFGRIGITVPTPEHLAANGVDFTTLGAVHERMSAEGLEPRLVLAPSLNTSDWQQLYSNLRADGTIVGNPLKNQIDGDGLYIEDRIINTWDDLNGVPDNVPVTLDTAINGSCNWTLRLLPGTNRPSETNIAHNDPNYPDKPTVHEYLTLQANLLQAGEAPIDDSTWTWLDGTLENDSQAPNGRWYQDEGQVRLISFDARDRDGDIGMRPPVWEQTNA